MADELIDRLRAEDPLPDGSAAPPFDSVYSRLPDRPSRGRSNRRWRTRQPRSGTGVLLPVLTLAVTLGVVAVVVGVLLSGSTGGDQATAGRRHHGALSGPTPVAPRTGMAGYVTVWGAAFNDDGAGVVSLEQCLHCQADGNQTRSSSFHDWLLSTRDGGLSWALSPEDYYLANPEISATSGWSAGMQVYTRAESVADHAPAQWEPGATTPTYYDSQDSGLTWTPASKTAQPIALGTVSLKDGRTWGTAISATSVSILEATAGSRRLAATASQPRLSGYDTNTRVLAAGAQLAYVFNPDEPGQNYVTHDDGVTWSHIVTPPCSGRFANLSLDAADGQTVYLTCSTGAGEHATATLLRSVDGGHSWQTIRQPWGGGFSLQISEVTPQVAWELTPSGQLWRTTDAGYHWTAVWSLANTAEHPLSGPIPQPSEGPIPILSAQSAAAASIITLLNRHRAPGTSKLTNLVAYRTGDGGASWRAEVIPLTPSAAQVRASARAAAAAAAP